MSVSTDNVIKRYSSKGVFVDANLLLLWFVGGFDREMITSFKRTSTFVPEDFDTLDAFLHQFKTLVTTPNVLTEVSNLVGNFGGRAEVFYKRVFSRAIQAMNEEYVPSVSVVGKDEIGKFGLTDCAIMALVKNKYLLLTDDFPLSQYFESIGGAAVNFNHIRPFNWR